MKKFLLATIIMAITAFAAEYNITNPANPSDIIAKIQKEGRLKQPKPKPGMLKAYSIATYDLNFDTSRDLLTSIGDANGNHLFYLISNITQNDPTSDISVGYESMASTSTYRCDYNLVIPAQCSFQYYHERVDYATNTVAGWFKLTSYPTSNDDLVIIDRNNTERGADVVPLMIGKPYFKVFVDTQGYLNAQFTLITGGAQYAKTSQPIPLNTDVYLQANNTGVSYEVGWKTADGQSSTGTAAHQGASIPGDIEDHRYALTHGQSPIILVSFPYASPSNALETFTKLSGEYGATKLFFSGYETLFASMNATDVSGKSVYQIGAIIPLTLDSTFVDKVANDILGNTNYFDATELRLFVDSNYNVIAADVRTDY